MTTRTRAVALATASLLTLFASIATAGLLTGPRLASDNLKFRTHRNTYTQALQGCFSDLPGNSFDAVDSSYSARLGTQICILDTTTAVATATWWRPGVSTVALAAADTNFVYCTLVVADANALSSTTADSLYIAAQASYDGIGWFTLGTLAAGTPGSITSRLDQTQGGGTFQGVLNKLGASGGTPTWAWQYKLRTPNTQAADQSALWKYPLLRWIVGIPDAVNYSIRAHVEHLDYTVGDF